MARKRVPGLTDAELRIMRVLWSRPAASVNDVVGAIRTPKLARNTVMTTLGVLERKGFVRHAVDGRTFVYRAAVERNVVQKNALDDLVARLFDSSPSRLVATLLDSRGLGEEEAAVVRSLLARAREKS